MKDNIITSLPLDLGEAWWCKSFVTFVTISLLNSMFMLHLNYKIAESVLNVLFRVKLEPNVIGSMNSCFTIPQISVEAVSTSTPTQILVTNLATTNISRFW